MKRARVVTTALVLLVVGASTMAQAQNDRGKKQEDRPQQKGQPARVSPEEQKQRVQQQQQRDVQYKQRLDQQVRAQQQQQAQLQQQQRTAQLRVQQDYSARLRQQQQEQSRAQTRNYSNDPYVITPHNYRYTVSGATRQTNQYGADVLRQAVNYGYQQGFRAGDADRQDRRPATYQNSFGYLDANYGYGGQYVDQSDYNYYFREGFRRGYDDGYYRRSQYGRLSNGTPSILGNLLTGILGLLPIR
jgi:TolA-binding protein